DVLFCFFFFQAEDGIRDFHVTGVQTCALPISRIYKDIIHMTRNLNVKRLTLFVATIFTLTLTTSSITSSSSGQDPKSARQPLRTIVLDAGHGGKDPGAKGRKANEKDIALAVALKLGKKIEAELPGVKVVYTRKTDIFIPLYERPALANKHKADLFISIHCNAAATRRSPARGTETLV